MIICMSKLFCITNRNLCNGDFLRKIEEIACCHPDGIILREKDLHELDYTALAEKVLTICSGYDVSCILHSFVNSAVQLHAERIHLPMPILRTLSHQDKEKFSMIGTSCHSVEEAQEAVSLGVNYLIAGHIFDTDCKKGLAGRGTAFLRSVCQSVDIPVYAIGGITPENHSQVLDSGADGVCIMSSLMQCQNASELICRFR